MMATVLRDASTIKAKGGTTFAQDKSAEVDGMPLSAQASGCVDFVLPPDKISHATTKIGKNYCN
jgi:two-component system CheB/CheR fusion protein